MNKTRPILLLTLLYLLILTCTASGQDEETLIIDPNRLRETVDEEIFIRQGFTQDFSEDQGYVNELPNPVTIHQYYIYGGEGTDLLMTMNPSEMLIRTTNKRLKFEQYRAETLHATYSVQRKENIPSGSGGRCWIRYSNVVVAGEGKESGLIFYPGDMAYHFSPADGELVYEAIADLSDLNPDRRTDFEFIRLDGTTYIYINGKFRFSYTDGITDRISFEGGAELFEAGNRVRCNFDDFSIRTK